MATRGEKKTPLSAAANQEPSTTWKTAIQAVLGTARRLGPCWGGFTWASSQQHLQGEEVGAAPVVGTQEGR